MPWHSEGRLLGEAMVMGGNGEREELRSCWCSYGTGVAVEYSGTDHSWSCNLVEKARREGTAKATVLCTSLVSRIRYRNSLRHQLVPRIIRGLIA